MPEVLRDLVVSLSLKTDNFSRNINSINRQIREAESAFRLAGAGIDNFGNTTAGMSSRLSMLQANLGHQRDAVGQWERALATANARLQESHARYTEYSGRLDEARQKHQALGDAIKDQEAYLQQIADLCGTDCDAYRAEAEVLERLKAEYAASGAEVKKLEGQCNGFLEAIHLFSSTDEDVQQILNLADTVDFLRGKMEEFREAGDWSTAGQMELEVGATLGEIDAQLQNLNDQDIANIGQEAAQLMAALASGNLNPEQMESYAAELQRIYDLMGYGNRRKSS